MIKNVIGDALSQGTDIVAHQTNCVGVMGAGIARQIKDTLSQKEFQKYKNRCEVFGKELLGTVQYLATTDGTIIANVFGENVPTNNEQDTDYEALYKGLQKVCFVATCSNQTVTIPGLMGCGLAGGDWDYVLHKIIEPIFSESSVELTIAYFRKEDFDKYVKNEEEED